MNKTKDTRYMVTLALMAAIVILLANTPLGMIQLPIIKATTVHIPVIIGSIVLGPAAGAFLGAVFGICSMISNTQAPTLLSFAFSPFLSTTGLVGVIKALWVSIGCRIMIGVVSGWVSIALKNLKIPTAVRLAITGFVGSMTNTVFVMGSIYLLFAQQYAEVKNVGMEAVFGLVMGTVAASGIPEAIAAARPPLSPVPCESGQGSRSEPLRQAGCLKGNICEGLMISIVQNLIFIPGKVGAGLHVLPESDFSGSCCIQKMRSFLF